MLRTGALQDKSPGGVVGHQGPVGRDLHRRDLLVQGHLGQRGADAAGHRGRLVRAQVDDLKVDGGRDKEVVLIWSGRGR